MSATLGASARELAQLVRPDDVVILHDPQTAGLVSAVHDTGATVIWRCHVGVDHANVRAREAWDFLLPYLSGADAYIFSRPAFVWDRLAREKIAVIQPSIDVFSPKNADQTLEQSLAILAQAGVVTHRGPGDPRSPDQMELPVAWTAAPRWSRRLRWPLQTGW